MSNLNRHCNGKDHFQSNEHGNNLTLRERHGSNYTENTLRNRERDPMEAGTKMVILQEAFSIL